jgi:flagellar FliL protein
MSDKHASPAPAHDDGAKKPGLLGQLKVGGIIAGIVLMQCLLAYFLLPSAPSEAAQETTHGKKHAPKDSADHGDAHGDHAAEHASEDEHAEQREVDLGRFSITAYSEATETTRLIDFHLYGAVVEEPKPEDDHAAADAHGGHGGGHGAPAKGAEPEDESKFGKLFKKHKHRFRDQVIITVRNSSPADLADPALGLIKRQILAKTNSLLGEPLLKEVIFSEFSAVQQ